MLKRFTRRCGIRFHSIGFPSEWGQSHRFIRAPFGVECFHSIGFPSEWGPNTGYLFLSTLWRFHSIGFPSEWGLSREISPQWIGARFPFNWFPQRVGTCLIGANLSGVIGKFPFNWFPQRVGTRIQTPPALGEGSWAVSIQLVSPASGDACQRDGMRHLVWFPFNWFPQRVGTLRGLIEASPAVPTFPFNWFPQRVGTPTAPTSTAWRPPSFPFNWFPQRVGTSLGQTSSG